MDIYICTRGKKANSTYKFDYTLSDGTVAKLECTLKNPCSVLSPVIIIDTTDQGKVNLAKYASLAYIPDFNRYYVVTEVTFANALMVLSLNVDVLATYFDGIKSQSFYVERTGVKNPAVVDNSYPMLTDPPTISGSNVTNPLCPRQLTSNPDTWVKGCFVVGVINDVPSMYGNITYYIMSQEAFYEVCQNLFTIANFGNIGSTPDAIAKSLIDPFQYIISVMWFPWETTDFYNRGYVYTTPIYDFRCGFYNVTNTTYYFYAMTIDTMKVEFTNMVTLAIPKHSATQTRGDWVNLNPFARYYLSFYPFGHFELDSTMLQNKTYLYLVYTTDLRTGKAILSIGTEYTGSDYSDWKMPYPMRKVDAQIGVEIPVGAIKQQAPSQGELIMQLVATLGQTQTPQGTSIVKTTTKQSKLPGLINSLSNAWAAATSPNGINPKEELSTDTVEVETVDIPGTIANIASTALAMKSTVEFIGQQGDITHYFTEKLALYAYFYNPAAMDASRGYPYAMYTNLVGLTGFTVCSNAHPSMGCFKEERIIMENYLNTGFVIE